MEIWWKKRLKNLNEKRAFFLKEKSIMAIEIKPTEDIETREDVKKFEEYQKYVEENSGTVVIEFPNLEEILKK